MGLSIRKVQVWTGEIHDRPGAAAATLEHLARSGADLEFVFTRASASKPDTTMIFLAPIAGEEQTFAAKRTGLAPASEVTMLCVEGNNRAGIGYAIMSRLAVAGINLRGLSISAVNERFAAYLAFDNQDTATMAVQILATIDM